MEFTGTRRDEASKGLRLAVDTAVTLARVPPSRAAPAPAGPSLPARWPPPPTCRSSSGPSGSRPARSASFAKTTSPYACAMLPNTGKDMPDAFAGRCSSHDIRFPGAAFEKKSIFGTKKSPGARPAETGETTPSLRLPDRADFAPWDRRWQGYLATHDRMRPKGLPPSPFRVPARRRPARRRLPCRPRR